MSEPEERQRPKQKKVSIGGREFIAYDTTSEELGKLPPDHKEWLLFIERPHDKPYKIRKTKELLQAAKLDEEIKKEIEELRINDWLDKNRPGLDKELKWGYTQIAGIIYHDFRVKQRLFKNNIITKKQVREIVFDFLKTEKPEPERVYEKLFKAEEKLKELRKKPISPGEIEDTFQRLLQRKEIIADPKLVKDLPVVAPYQLDKRYLVEETETSTEMIKKYERDFGNETVTYTFFIPKAEYKENRIPTFGADMRKALLIACTFAKEQKSLSPIFRKQHIFKLQGKEGNKISGRAYTNLDNGWRTLAYVTYERENNKKGKEYRKRIGHIVDNVDWIGKGRGGFINPTLNRKYFSNLAALIEGEETGYQFLSISKDRLTEKWPRDEENFLNYIDSLKGTREVYPIQIKTIFVEKLGYRMETLRKMGSGQISKTLNKCLERAKVTGRLKHWRLDYRGDPSFRNILNWKIKLFLSREK